MPGSPSFDSKKALVIAGLVLCNISEGFIIGQMSGMIGALRADDSPIPLSDDDVSWIASVQNLTCVCGYALLGVICEYFGRRQAVVLLNIPVLATWIILYYVQSKTILLISRVVIGIFFGGILILSYINVGEYISPKSRTFYTNFVCGVGPLIGIMLGHVLSTVINWRYVALIGIVPTTLSIIFPFFWYESPSWLASKGLFDECEHAFTALRGSDYAARMELKSLLEFEKNKQRTHLIHSRNTTYSKIFKALKYKWFWKVFALGAVDMIYRIASGRVLFSTYAITLLQDLTGQKNIILFAFSVDLFTIIGALLSCVLVKKFKLRQLALYCGFVSNSHLVLLSGCIYYLPTSNYYFSCIKVCILASYFVILSAGPYAVLESLVSEIFPLETKAFSLFLLGILSSSLQFLSIKSAPNMFTSIGYHGVFLFNAAVVGLCLLYLWAYMPETKGRTLLEIEAYFRTGRFEHIDANKNNKLLSSSANFILHEKHHNVAINSLLSVQEELDTV